MDLLLGEYNSSVDLLRREVESCKLEQRELKAKIINLVSDNRKLINELKESIQARMDEGPGGISADYMTQQLRDTITAKDTALQMWQSTMQELENQKITAEDSVKDVDNADAVGKQIAAIKEQYSRGIRILSNELSEMREYAANLKETLKSQSLAYEKAEASLKEQSELLKTKNGIIDDSVKECDKLKNEVLTISSELEKYKKCADCATKELVDFKQQNKELILLKESLQKTLVDVRAKKALSEKEAKDSLFAAQEAIRQKEEFSYKAQQALKTIESMKSSISKEVEHATLRYRNEIKNLQKQQEERVQTLLTDIDSLHKDNTEKQSLLEKITREKQAIESKLENCSVESTKGNFISSAMFDDMCKRLTLSEKVRDEAVFKAKSLEASVKDLKANSAKATEFFNTEIKCYKEQLHRIKRDLNETISNRIQLSDKIVFLNKKCISLDKDIKSLRHRHQNSQSAFEELLKEKQVNYKQQIQSKEEHYKSIITELSQLLEAQHKINCKWKVTTTEITVKSEIKVAEMLKEIQRLQNENEELRYEIQSMNETVT